MQTEKYINSFLSFTSTDKRLIFLRTKHTHKIDIYKKLQINDLKQTKFQGMI